MIGRSEISRWANDFGYTAEQRTEILQSLPDMRISRQIAKEMTGIEGVPDGFEGSAESLFVMRMETNARTVLFNYGCHRKVSRSDRMKIAKGVSKAAEQLQEAMMKSMNAGIYYRTRPHLLDLIEEAGQQFEAEDAAELSDPYSRYHDPHRQQFFHFALQEFQNESGQRPGISRDGPAARHLKAAWNPVADYVRKKGFSHCKGRLNGDQAEAVLKDWATLDLGE